MNGAKTSARPYWVARSIAPIRLGKLCSVAAWLVLLFIKHAPPGEPLSQIPGTDRAIGIYEAPRSKTWAMLIGINGYQKNTSVEI
jgi:hypothetical protein